MTVALSPACQDCTNSCFGSARARRMKTSMRWGLLCPHSDAIYPQNPIAAAVGLKTEVFSADESCSKALLTSSLPPLCSSSAATTVPFEQISLSYLHNSTDGGDAQLLCNQ